MSGVGRGVLQEEGRWSRACCAGAPTLMGTGRHSEAGGTSISLDLLRGSRASLVSKRNRKGAWGRVGNSAQD